MRSEREREGRMDGYSKREKSILPRRERERDVEFVWSKINNRWWWPNLI